jgi:hypothetical protein
MTVYSISDRMAGWITDQIGKEDPLDGDEWGYGLSLDTVQTPAGNTAAWVILVSLRAPFLGRPPIAASMKLTGMPPEPLIRQVVKKLVSDLRQAFEQQKTGMVNAPALNLPGLPGAMKQGPN